MILFLDLDGVMIDGAPWKKLEIKDNFPVFLKSSVKNLNYILEKLPDLKIVLISSHSESKNLVEWDHVFRVRGVKNFRHIYKSGVDKFDLHEYISKYVNPNEKYAIVDDDIRLRDVTELDRSKIVSPHSSKGLCINSVNEVMDILVGPSVWDRLCFKLKNLFGRKGAECCGDPRCFIETKITSTRASKDEFFTCPRIKEQVGT